MLHFSMEHGNYKEAIRNSPDFGICKTQKVLFNQQNKLDLLLYCMYYM